MDAFNKKIYSLVIERDEAQMLLAQEREKNRQLLLEIEKLKSCLSRDRRDDSLSIPLHQPTTIAVDRELDTCSSGSYSTSYLVRLPQPPPRRCCPIPDELTVLFDEEEKEHQRDGKNVLAECSTVTERCCPPKRLFFPETRPPPAAASPRLQFVTVSREVTPQKQPHTSALDYHLSQTSPLQPNRRTLPSLECALQTPPA